MITHNLTSNILMEMEGIIFCVCLVFISSLLITKSFSNPFRSSPKKGRPAPAPPSVPSLPILGHIHLFKTPIHRSLAALSARYGPILSLRLGFTPVLLISSPSLVEECFTKNDVILADRPILSNTRHVGLNKTTVVWSPYGPYWRKLRRIAVVQALSSHRLQMFSGVRHGEIRALLKELFSGKTDLPLRVNLKTKFSDLTLNLMMRIIAGKRYYGERVADVEEAARYREVMKGVLALSGASNLRDHLPFLRWIGYYMGVEKKMMDTMKTWRALMQKLIDERREKTGPSIADPEERNKTLIDILLSPGEKETEYYTDDIIKATISALVGAGTDTTSVTLEWAMSLLLNHPEVLQKAKAEINTAVGSDRLLDESDLVRLPYLYCIIKETLRLQPAVPLLLPHFSSSDCSIGGFHVPKGTMILVNAWAIHRDITLWKDPLSFKPERFEGLDDQNERDGMGFKYIPFGYGRRSCPGMNMAMKSIGLTLGCLIQCFQWARVGQEMVDMTEEGNGISMPKAQPLEVIYKPYEDMIGVLLGL